MPRDPNELAFRFLGSRTSRSRPKDKFRIGTEHEKFVFFRKDNSPVPYFGDASISAGGSGSL